MLRVSLFAVLLTILPFVGEAAGLVPCGGEGEAMCDTAFAVQFANGLISFLIQMLGIIAVIVLVIAGFQLVVSAGNEQAWTAAKERITNIIIGIIIILAAWLIVDTILKGLTGEGLRVWGVIDRSEVPEFIYNDSNPAGAHQYTDSDARTALAAAGISVNKTEAQGTSLDKINKSTVEDVIAFKNECNCNVVFTGGTESTGGHAAGTQSHATGYKYDMRVDQQIDQYIISNFEFLGTRSDGARQYKSARGSIYAREGDHWDVLVR